MYKVYKDGIVIEIKDATDILPTLRGIGEFLKSVIDEDKLTDRQKQMLDDICAYGIALSRWDDDEIKLKGVYCYGSNGSGEPKLCDRKGCKCGIIECTTMDDILNDQYPIYIKGMNDDICVRDDSVTDEYKHVINQRYSPVDFCNYGECPTCGETVSGFSIASPNLYDKECPKCGQKLKW